MKHLRALWRVLRSTAHVVHGLWIIRSEFGRLSHADCQLLVREWSRKMLRLMGVELVVQGEVPAHGPLMMVANHLSWLDILVMNAAHPSRFVSKADAQHWPLLGSLITGAGTLTTLRQDFRELGNRAMNLLLSEIAGTATKKLDRLIPELVLRASTTAPPKL